MQLLPESLRRPAAALLAVCLTAMAVTGVRSAHYRLPDWLDATFDPRIQAQLGRFPVLLTWLPDLGTLEPVAAMTLALIVGCTLVQRWRGALLAAVAVPVAIGLTEYLLKPTVGVAIGQGFPSGHATSMFALAASCAVLLAAPSRHRLSGTVRLLLALVAVLVAAAVAAVMVANGSHSFTDAVGGAAVGTAVVLACAFILDWLARWWERVLAVPLGPGG
jgi:membrane-associated phospholipid phosphatase